MGITIQNKLVISSSSFNYFLVCSKERFIFFGRTAMSWHNIEFIIGTVSLVFAYLFSVTVVGIAEGAVAEWAGDDTAKEAGLLSGNPLIYLDLIGFICTMVIGFGWGRILP